MTPEAYIAQGNILAQLLICKRKICELENEKLGEDIVLKDAKIRDLEEQVRKLTRKATINSSNSS